MLSKILLNKNNLISNIEYIKSQKDGKICFMVKANAYGHGLEEIVKMSKEHIDYYGVSNQKEAQQVRALTDKPVIVFGGCDDYFVCMANKIEFALTSLEQAKEIIKIYKNSGVKPLMHLCINSGMNRYGVRDLSEMKKILLLLQKNSLSLAGVYTHFSSLSTDEEYTKLQWKKFQEFAKLVPKEWSIITHIGGGGTIYCDYQTDMFRVGLFCYGYGDEKLKPVMQVKSQIVDIQKVVKGEHIGYLCGYTAEKGMKIGVVPLGYGDGLPRKLSNNFTIEIAGKKVKQVGNVCMDAFMVDLDRAKCSVGDDVVIMKNASDFTDKLQTTEYEIMTNFSKFRGDRIII